MENFGGLVAEIFDRMDRAAGGDKHFALGDGELRMLVAAGEKGDKHFPFQAVAEFVGVRVPMRLAEAFRIQREPFEDGEVGFIDGGFDTAVVGNLELRGAERGFVGHAFSEIGLAPPEDNEGTRICKRRRFSPM